MNEFIHQLFYVTPKIWDLLLKIYINDPDHVMSCHVMSVGFNIHIENKLLQHTPFMGTHPSCQDKRLEVALLQLSGGVVNVIYYC